MRNKKLPYEYNISISVVVGSEDIDEVLDYANDLMEDIRGDEDVVDAIWYNITPIRKCRPKRREKMQRIEVCGV